MKRIAAWLFVATLLAACGGTPVAQHARIAFSSERDGNLEIHVMNADGTGLTNLTNNSAGDHSPAWCP